MTTQVLDSSAVWGVLLTLAAFGLGVLINKRTGKAIFNPLLLGTAFVIVVLSVLNIPYDTYAASASPISYLLLPATVSLAVPLYRQLELLKTYILEKKDIRSNETIAKHADWTESFLPSYPEINAENVTHILEQEVGKVFCQVLEDAGVYKCTDEGLAAFDRFVETL